jgi:hypothetical protein
VARRKVDDVVRPELERAALPRHPDAASQAEIDLIVRAEVGDSIDHPPLIAVAGLERPAAARSGLAPEHAGIEPV